VIFNHFITDDPDATTAYNDYVSLLAGREAAGFARPRIVAFTCGYSTALSGAQDTKPQFLTLMQHSPLFVRTPPLGNYLERFPAVPLAGAESFLYWSKETVAFHAVVSVTHVAVYTPPARSPFLVIVGTRQVYASRYFDASLGMTVMFETTSSAHPVAPFEFLYVNRSRTDELTGFWGGLNGPIVRSRARAALHKYLALLKTRLERDVIAQAPDGPIP
jgi:hypothetical protein